MKRLSYKYALMGFSLNYKPTSNKQRIDEIKVQNNLSVTPSQMFAMAAKGVPITTSNEANFYDGEPNPTWQVDPVENRRMNIVDIWNMQRDSAKKLKNAHHEDRRLYD